MSEKTIADRVRPSNDLYSIQYLRIVAALLVVGCHLEPQLRHLNYRGAWPQGLASGVDVFFVISGFIMWFITFGRPTSPRAFLINRIIRIVPLYWMITAFVLLVLIVSPNLLQSTRTNPVHAISSFLFIPILNPSSGALEPVVLPGWTLNYEMFFYLVFAVFLAAPMRWRLVGTVGSLLFLAAIGAVCRFPPLSLAQFYTAGIIVEFALGMILGWLFTRNLMPTTTPRFVAWTMIIGGLVVSVFAPSSLGYLRLPIREAAAMAVVAGALLLERRGAVRRLALPETLGNASYSIYLSHLIALSAISQAWRKLHLSQSPLGLATFCLVELTAAIVVGYAIYRVVETPIRVAIRRARRPRLALA